MSGDVPKQVGRFDLLERRRTPGAASVYRGRDLESGAAVDLEIQIPNHGADMVLEAQVRSRSEALGEIRHRSLVPHVGVELDDGVVAIATEPAPGESLRELIATEGPLEPARASRVIADVAGALDQLHLRGLVHGRLTSDSIIVDGDRARLRDVEVMPLAALRPGRAVPDADTFAPERIERLPHTGSDVYALGCVALEALTGSPPFLDGGSAAKLAAHRTKRPPLPSERRPELGTRFDVPIATALAKEPEARYQTAGELGRAMVGAAGAASPPPKLSAAERAPARRTAVRREPERRPERPPERSRPSISGGVALAILAGVLAVVAVVLVIGGGGDGGAQVNGTWQGQAAVRAAGGTALPLRVEIRDDGRDVKLAASDPEAAGAFSAMSVEGDRQHFTTRRDGSRITMEAAEPAQPASAASQWRPARGAEPIAFDPGARIELAIDGDRLTGRLVTGDGRLHEDLAAQRAK